MHIRLYICGKTALLQRKIGSKTEREKETERKLFNVGIQGHDNMQETNTIKVGINTKGK